MRKQNQPERIDLFNDSRLVLFQNIKRGKLNPIWQAYIKSPSSTGRLRISTKTANFEQAKKIATDEYYRAEARLQQGLPLNPARFDDTALEYLRWAENEQIRGRMTANMRSTHQNIIESLLIPYFGSTYLHHINTKAIEAYQDQRKTVGAVGEGKTPKGSTLNRDASIIKAIFRYAIREEYIKEAPQMPKHHHFAQRASFTRGEMKKLQKKLDEWVDMVSPLDGGHVRDYRELFRLYVLIITYTGIRPGKEMCSLQWSDISYPKTKAGEEFPRLIAITSKSKKMESKKRPVVGMPQLIPHLKRFEELGHLYDKSKPIFIHPKTTQLNKAYIGKPIQTFKKQWTSFIEWAELKHEAKEPHRERQLYSCRHYYFEQRLLRADVPMLALAKNGGTSIQVLEKWYAELQSDQYADGLAGIIERENS